MASMQPMIARLNRRLMAQGSEWRIRAKCVGPLAATVRFTLYEAPEVERRVGRYLRREGD